ncbi:poly(R)-hydroxyalkanoic acid synthase subunit PhaE [Motiliproteus sp.]|uniref:poly(R)-hydroxyalkanoic acid synthase subunit PhaE n=1 Tax=Motiliproteus sp. TaxID=1898955 RepID=UPI003BAD0B42
MNPSNLDQLNQWLEQQQAHWRGLLGDEPQPAADWQTLFDQGRQLNGQSAELTEAMIRQAKGFSDYGERLLQSLQQSDQPDNLEQLVKALSAHLQTQADGAFYQQTQLPAPLQQLLQQMGLSPQQFSSFPFLHDSLNRNAERQQQQAAKLLQGLTRFQDALRLYIEQHHLINQQTTDRMIEQLKNAVEPPESLSVLHQIWVDCYEVSYKEKLEHQDYQRIYGELTNATLLMQCLIREYWQHEYRTFGLVPQQDYDQLLQQHHQLRKAHKKAERRQRKIEQQLLEQQHLLTQLQTQLDAANGDADQ